MMHDLLIPITKLHQYPVGLNVQYLLQPDEFPNLLDLDDVERTFLGENKQYWAEAAKSNIRAINNSKSLLASGNQLWDEQDEPLTDSQLEYKARLESQIQQSKVCFKEANKRRKTGFGLASNVSKETLPLRIFYLKLWAFISNTDENIIFKNSIVERTLNTIRVKYFYDEALDEGFGVDNHTFIKHIVANINFIEPHSYDFNKLNYLTEKVSKDLSLFAGKQYKTPQFNV
jgi:hypothetical protein